MQMTFKFCVLAFFDKYRKFCSPDDEMHCEGLQTTKWWIPSYWKPPHVLVIRDLCESLAGCEVLFQYIQIWWEGWSVDTDDFRALAFVDKCRIFRNPENESALWRLTSKKFVNRDKLQTSKWVNHQRGSRNLIRTAYWMARFCQCMKKSIRVLKRGWCQLPLRHLGQAAEEESSWQKSWGARGGHQRPMEWPWDWQKEQIPPQLEMFGQQVQGAWPALLPWNPRNT